MNDEIASNVPVPPEAEIIRFDPVKTSRIKFENMQVGDSTLVNLTEKKIGEKIRYWKRKHPNQQFVAAKEYGGIRIWRTN